MKSKEVLSTLKNHVTIRNFTDQPIDNELVMQLLRAARRSPTSSNMQTYSIIVVRNPAVKKELAVLAGGQQHVETCPVFFAFCADIYKLEQACELHNVKLQKTVESTLVSTVDAALVGMSVQTAAESVGLGAVMIGAMRNHPAKVAKLLGLPKGVYVVYGMCLGWPDEAQIPPQKPRLPEDTIIHFETYKTDNMKEAFEAHNEELAMHYESLGRNQDNAAWSGPIANRLQKPSRPELRKTLEDLGMSFD